MAKEAVNCLFYGETNPEEVMRTLEARFGRPDALVIAEIEKLRALPKLTDSARDTCIAATKVNNIVATMKALNKENYLNNPTAIRIVLEKLTPSLLYRWYDYIATQKEDSAELPHMAEFLNREAERCGRYAAPEDLHARLSGTSETKTRRIQRAHVTHHRETTSTAYKARSCLICNETERVLQVPHEKTISPSLSHEACGIDSCRGTHHRMLHNSERPPTSRSGSSTQESSCQAVVTSARPSKPRAHLKIVPIRLTGPKANIDTYALLDEGSTITLIDAAVAEAVGVAGTPEPFHIEGVAGTAVDASASQRVTLEIRGRHHKKTHQITAHTMDRLNLFTQTVDRDEIVAHKHLRDIANDLCYEHAHPTVLIGQDNWPLIITRAVRGGRKSEPAASYTELGWVLHGGGVVQAHQVHCARWTPKQQEAAQIEVLLKQYFDLDSLGIEPKRPASDPDQRALDILRARTRQNDEGRYETGLLWRSNEVRLPNNYEAALSRLIKLEKRLDQNEALKRPTSTDGAYNRKWLCRGRRRPAA
ncbi:hypothetical protein EVAR_43531_1 [Eumeta japonica]|uniref:Uncharacterized protein n=1 Tax=Eumeta variegata TaxID=151549 RepID=A0A4C1WAE4_EUMVA|nr:hypothetical protein EVAR_43531_1 [Eumeta japonica]